MAGKDTNIGAKRARETRKQLEFDARAPIPCVLSLVEELLQLPVIIAALPEGVAGCCWRDGDRVVLWVNGTQAAVRQRFTLAHELGHVRCLHDQGVPVDTVQTLAGKTTDSREIQGNAFAAELLAPAAGLREMVDGPATLTDVVRVAAAYGTSTIAAMYRLHTLELVDDYAGLRTAIENGEHLAVWEELDPAPFGDLIGQLDPAQLPRLSPSLSGSALGALVARETTVADAAAASQVEVGRLEEATRMIGA